MGRLVIRSLRARLQLFSLLLVVVPGVLFALIAFASARRSLEHAVGRQLAEIAHDAAEGLQAALTEQRTALRTWARQDVMRDVLIGDLDKRLSRFLRSLEEGDAPYLDLAVVDTGGRVVAASDPALIGADHAARGWARAALAGDEFFAGPASAPGEAPAIEMAVPIRAQERTDGVIGALLGRYDWRRAVAAAARVRESVAPLGMTVEVAVVDRNGAVLGGSAPGAMGTLATGPRPRWIVDAENDVLLGEATLDDPELGWATVVSERLSEAFAPVRAMQTRFAAALAAVLLGALGVATILAGRMSRPLRALTWAAEQMGRAGETPRPVAVRSRDEIGQLAAAFNQMTGALRTAQEDLLVAAKFAFVGEVAAGIAHEIRTPLGILRSSAQILGRSLPSGTGESTELVNMIVEEVDRLDRVVAGLLELARPHAPLVEPTPLSTVLVRAVDFVEPQARERGVTIRRDFAPGPPARCDPEQMYQVALNLIVNALQILPAGGHVTVRVLPRRDGRVAFEVTDDGPGIPVEVRERIFSPFFTLRPGGTGLGLALVQRVVQAHQGSVTVDSEVGRGTTFRIELPVAEDRR